jgi:hypothetical protein
MPKMCDSIAVVGDLVCLAADAVGGVTDAATEGLLSVMADTFARGAEAVLEAVFDAISTTTTVDLGAGYVTGNAAALTSVALVLVVGLFVVQVVTAAVRSEPGGLGRALTGAAVAVLGAAAAATVTQTLLLAVDAICDGIAGLAGTSIEGAARQLLDVSVLLGVAATGGGAALLLVFSLLFIIGATLTLGTLLVRQALIVVAVVAAPLAFAGGASRLTSGWVRRWIQVTLALILSKLAIVVVFVVAVGMVGTPTGLGGLLSGLILLLLACLAPWACFKILDFAGTAVAAEWHRATNGSTVAALNQGRMSAQSLMRSVAPVIGGTAAGAVAGAGAASRGGAASLPAQLRDADAVPTAVGGSGAVSGTPVAKSAGEEPAHPGSGMWAVPPTAAAWQPSANGRDLAEGTSNGHSEASAGDWAVPPTAPAWQPPPAGPGLDVGTSNGHGGNGSGDWAIPISALGWQPPTARGDTDPPPPRVNGRPS